MWQAQLKGSKIWKLLPPPECENVCSSVSFVANPGDAGITLNYNVIINKHMFIKLTF